MAIIGNGIINSTILYGAPVWGVTKKANLEKIQTCQIKAGRVIDGYGSKGKKSHRQDLLDKLKWPNVTQIVNSAILNQTKRALGNMASKGLNNIFKKTFPKHQRGENGWRIVSNIPMNETKITFPSIAQDLFNNLPTQLRDMNLTIAQFKKALKPHILSTNQLEKH